jgi:hypothetical protein
MADEQKNKYDVVLTETRQIRMYGMVATSKENAIEEAKYQLNEIDPCDLDDTLECSAELTDVTLVTENVDDDGEPIEEEDEQEEPEPDPDRLRE